MRFTLPRTPCTGRRLLLTTCVVIPLIIGGCFASATRTADLPTSATPISPSAWIALSKPGPSHHLLDGFVGRWKTRISFRTDPAAPAQLSEGSSTIDWILGKRFIKEEFSGEVLGERFNGFGMTGYDNARQRFSNLWVDSMNTAMATALGTYDTENHRFDFIGEVYDPLQGSPKTNRSSLTIHSDDTFKFSMFEKAPDGTEYAALEIEYTRQAPERLKAP